MNKDKIKKILNEGLAEDDAWLVSKELAQLISNIVNKRYFENDFNEARDLDMLEDIANEQMSGKAKGYYNKMLGFLDRAHIQAVALMGEMSRIQNESRR
jgi:hypothetical protein